MAGTMNPIKRQGSEMMLKGAIRTVCLLILLFLATGCATVPSHYVKVVPAPNRRFPPPQPALVRLPVEIVFPAGKSVYRRVSNFLKGELSQLTPYLLEMPGLHLKAHIADLWSQMQVPIYLEKNIWLVIRPETLGIGRMRSDPKRLSSVHTVLEMTAAPEIVFGPRPPAVPRKMPPLHSFQAGPPVFQAVSNTRIGYKEINEFFRDPKRKLTGKVFPGTGGFQLTLKGIRFYGSGGEMIAEAKLQYNPLINFSGKPGAMTVYLRGTPRFHPRKRYFDFPDLDYDLKSGDILLEIADWVSKSGFRNELRKAIKLPIGPKMDGYKEIINKTLNRPLSPYVSLNTRVESFKLLGGYADNEGIVVRVSLDGTATMDVLWK
jgi:hypothetical protein